MNYEKMSNHEINKISGEKFIKHYEVVDRGCLGVDLFDETQGDLIPNWNPTSIISNEADSYLLPKIIDDLFQMEIDYVKKIVFMDVIIKNGKGHGYTLDYMDVTEKWDNLESLNRAKVIAFLRAWDALNEIGSDDE